MRCASSAMLFHAIDRKQGRSGRDIGGPSAGRPIRCAPTAMCRRGGEQDASPCRRRLFLWPCDRPEAGEWRRHRRCAIPQSPCCHHKFDEAARPILSIVIQSHARALEYVAMRKMKRMPILLRLWAARDIVAMATRDHWRLSRRAAPLSSTKRERNQSLSMSFS